VFTFVPQFRSIGIAALLVMALIPRPAVAQDFPAKSVDVAGGSLKMQGGVLGTKKEVLLFLIVINQTPQTIWVDVKFFVPGSDKPLTDLAKVGKGDGNMFKWSLGDVAWDTDYPFTVSVFEDKKRTKPRGELTEKFFFESATDRKPFEDARGTLPPEGATAVDGFRIEKAEVTEAGIEGTSADATLQGDVSARISAEEAKEKKDCDHQVLRAEPYAPDEKSLVAAQMGDRGLEMEASLRAKGKMVVERWFVKSCADTSAYEVLILRSGDGTDIRVQRIEN